MKTTEFEYQGNELELFAEARQWKAYFGSKLKPYFGARVLEVGAGFGAVTRSLLHEGVSHWTCLEPDPQLASRIRHTLSEHPLRERVEVICGTTSTLDGKSGYDTILYIDVLEHIEDDRQELRRAADLLAKGNVIVLSPAYQWLYTPFDQALRHFRRYTATSLAAQAPSVLLLEKVFYLDSAGLFASLGNKLMLRQSLPTLPQILFWDTYLIPLARVSDRLLAFRAGRSVVAIWRKTPEGEG